MSREAVIMLLTASRRLPYLSQMTKAVDQSLAVTTAVGSSFIPMKLPRFADRAEGREGQILVAALRCIVEKGIAATTTRAVAARANLNQGAIHYYFRGKDELLLGVLKGLMDTSTANARLVRDSSLSPVDKVNCILRSGTAFIEGDEVVASVSLWAHAIAKGGVWRDTYRRLFEEFREVLVGIIEEGIAKGIFKVNDARAVAETIITGVQGIGMHYVMSPSDFERYGLPERLMDLYMHFLGVASSPSGEMSNLSTVGSTHASK